MNREELLRSASNLYENPGTNEALKVVLEETYPELKESEDERIRKYIVKFVELEKGGGNLPPDDADKMLAYLERQKELAVIPDELVKNYKLFCEQGGRELALLINAINGFNKLKEQQPAEWSEEDEKMNEEIRQYLKQDRAEFPGRSARLNRMIGWLISLRPQLKYEWSEEDEVNLGDIKCALYDYYGEERAEELYNMLKSLHPQPREDTKCEPEEGDIVVNKDGVIAIFESWGHHPDGGSFNDHSYFFAKCTLDGDCYNEVDCHPDSWGIRYATPEEIRKLLPYLLVSYRPHWKPSEEQMRALNKVVNGEVLLTTQHESLESLYEQLKKL